MTKRLTQDKFRNYNPSEIAYNNLSSHLKIKKLIK